MTTTVKRLELKHLFPELIKLIQDKHIMGPEVEQELFVNHKPVQHLTTSIKCWAMFGTFYINYVMDHVIMDVETKAIGRAVAEVTFYDSFIEYEADRQLWLGSDISKSTGLNLN